MEQDMSKTLLDFYHKLLQPEFTAIKEKQTEHDGKFIDMLGHFDGVHKRLDNLEMEYHSLVGGMNRVELRQDRLENKIDGVEEKLGKKIDGIDEKLGKKIDGVEEKLTRKIDGVEDNLGKKIDGLAAKLKAHRVDTEVHRGVYGVRED